MGEWISVDERLPEKSGIYPTCSTNNGRRYIEDWLDSICHFDAEEKGNKSKWQHSSGFYDNGVTHWLDFPEPPKEQ